MLFILIHVYSTYIILYMAYIMCLQNTTVCNCFLSSNHLFLLLQTLGFPCGSVLKDSACQAGDSGNASSIPGLGRSSGGGNYSRLQYFCLGNSIYRGGFGPWGLKESDRI